VLLDDGRDVLPAPATLTGDALGAGKAAHGFELVNPAAWVYPKSRGTLTSWSP
jgi:hypothetical protein